MWMPKPLSMFPTVKRLDANPCYPKVQHPNFPDHELDQHPTIGRASSQPLRSLAWPGSGSQILNVRLQNTALTVVNATITLLDGNTAIASWTVQPPMGFKTYPFTLSTAQISLHHQLHEPEVMVQTVTCSVARVQFATATGTPAGE